MKRRASAVLPLVDTPALCAQRLTCTRETAREISLFMLEFILILTDVHCTDLFGHNLPARMNREQRSYRINRRSLHEHTREAMTLTRRHRIHFPKCDSLPCLRGCSVRRGHSRPVSGSASVDFMRSGALLQKPWTR